MIMLVAFITMTVDHIGSVFFPDILILRIIGRLAMPLFAWGIARGYRSTKDFKKYAIRLLLVSIVAQVPFYLLHGAGELNICFTLFMGLFLLKIYDSKKSQWVRWLSIMVIAALSQVTYAEYGIYGIFTIFLFHRFWNQESVIYYQLGITLVSVIVENNVIQLFSIFSIIPLLFYTRFKQNDFRLPRIVQYGFYPTHLLLFALLKELVLRNGS